jgi:hypothetical protein
MGLGINGCALWNILHFPRLINTLFMERLAQCNTLMGQDTPWLNPATLLSWDGIRLLKYRSKKMCLL